MCRVEIFVSSKAVSIDLNYKHKIERERERMLEREYTDTQVVTKLKVECKNDETTIVWQRAKKRKEKRDKNINKKLIVSC